MFLVFSMESLTHCLPGFIWLHRLGLWMEAPAEMKTTLLFSESLCVCVCVCARAHTRARAHAHTLSYVQLSAAPWLVTYQACLSMGFPRQEY